MKKKKVLKILLDVQEYTDLCWVCKKNGRDLPHCECRTNKQCAKVVYKYYNKGVKNERKNSKEN